MRQSSHTWRGYAGRDTTLARVDALFTPEGSLRFGGPPPLFRDLTAGQQDEVVATGRPIVLNRGALLFKQGREQDGIYLIESGRIKVFYVGPSGREITLAYWHAGNFVGGPEVFRESTHVWSGEAAVNSAVLHIPGAALRRHIERMPALALNVIEGLSFKGKCYSALAQMLGTRSPPERLAQLLLHLMDLYGVSEDVGTFITAHFTHQDLAHMTGVTRQSVTTTLRRFNDDGTLTWRGPNIVVLSIDKLRAARNGRRDGHTES